ncbi:hypothetical protein SAY87_021931 [Trapa incisa]|uniref:Biogenesis of lysosome-related organelles complex 1 subunit 7 n=1 Tax=Trapa incisa TaxID=236973 RepID=A0AAN7JSM4_9MYRT|nr:hypothetical protein SAY87_021931 [Trapa incisa]
MLKQSRLPRSCRHSAVDWLLIEGRSQRRICQKRPGFLIRGVALKCGNRSTCLADLPVRISGSSPHPGSLGPECRMNDSLASHVHTEISPLLELLPSRSASMEVSDGLRDSSDETPTVVVASNSQDSELTESSIDDGDGAVGDNSSRDALAKSISSLLSSVIKDFDSRAEGTLRSQDMLNSSIDRLTQQLDQLLDDAPSPFIMQHAARISNVRKRVTSLNAVLRSVQRRVDNIDRMLSVGLPHGMILFNCRSKNGFSGLVLSNKFGLYHISTGKMIAMCALILL